MPLDADLTSGLLTLVLLLSIVLAAALVAAPSPAETLSDSIQGDNL